MTNTAGALEICVSSHMEFSLRFSSPPLLGTRCCDGRGRLIAHVRYIRMSNVRLVTDYVNLLNKLTFSFLAVPRSDLI
jgi:hypothetical protein